MFENMAPFLLKLALVWEHCSISCFYAFVCFFVLFFENCSFMFQVDAFGEFSDAEIVTLLAANLSVKELVQSFSCRICTGFAVKILHNGDVCNVKRSWQGGALEVIGGVVRRGRFEGGKLCGGLVFSACQVKLIGYDSSLTSLCANLERLSMTSECTMDGLTQLVIGACLHLFLYRFIKNSVFVMGNLNGAYEAEYVVIPLGSAFPLYFLQLDGTSLSCKTGHYVKLLSCR
jgi:hypothetical protein